MGPTTGQRRSNYEARLATAHRALYNAADAAEDLGDYGAAEDCRQLQAEISRLMQDSLAGKKRKRRQLLLLPDDRAYL